MLPSQNRLSKKSDFLRLQKTGKIISSDSFSISFAPQEKSGPSRFGFIVSMKIAPEATIRNRAKRALREGVRQQISYIKEGFDCVFLAKPIIIKKYTDELMREVKEVLSHSPLSK